jgi:hypothetical protein
MPQQITHYVIRAGCEQRRVRRQNGTRARKRVVIQQAFNENAKLGHGAIVALGWVDGNHDD